MELVKYDAACRAVAEAVTIDEVKEITNRAEAARAYARQAKNRSMEIDAIEIRTRAERRLGEILLLLRKSGTIGQGRGGHDIHLVDLGVDQNISGAAQRLAKLSSLKFDEEIANWRQTAETSRNLQIPLQIYRFPTITADRQRAAARRGSKEINPRDPFDKYRSPDGRRMVDWRIGELDRVIDIFSRTVSCAVALRDSLPLPLANPDQLQTMEMVYHPVLLSEILERIWNEPIATSDAGLHRHKRESKCQNDQCGKMFIRSKPGSKERAGLSKGGLFCSRACMFAARKAKAAIKH